MAPIYQEIELEWEGVSYTVTPTYRLIQRLEQRISLAGLLHKVSSEAPPLSQLADLLEMVLRAAGCKAKSAAAEEINAQMYHDDNAEILVRAASSVLMALLPQRALSPGNAEAPKGAEANLKTSTGQSITESQLVSLASRQANSGI